MISADQGIMVGSQQNVTRRSPLASVNSVRETPRKSNVHKHIKTPRDSHHFQPKLLFNSDTTSNKSKSLQRISTGDNDVENHMTASQRSLDSSLDKYKEINTIDSSMQKRLTPKSHPSHSRISETASTIANDDDSFRHSGLSEVVANVNQVMIDNANKNKWSKKLKQTVQKILPRRKSDDGCPTQSIDLGSSIIDSDDEYYEAPTEFHAKCLTASTLTEICDSYNHTDESDRETLDYLGRTPVDLIFQNISLAKSVQSTDMTFDDEKVRKVAIFAINFLWQSKRNKLHLTWHVFTDWINTIDFGRKSREPDTLWLNVIASLHKQTKHRSNDVENPMSKSMERELPDMNEIDDPNDVIMPVQVQFALRLLSTLIKELDCNQTLRQSTYSVKEPSSRSRLSFDSVVTNDSLKSFGRKRKKNKGRKTSTDNEANPMCQTSLPFDNSHEHVDALVESFASIKHLMKSFIMVDDENVCKSIFEEGIIRRAMLKTQSIEGSWLSDMLQHDHRKRATDYLLLLSELSTKEARNAEKRSNTKMKHQLHDLLTRVGQLEGLIPSMLAVEERDIEDLATTPMITKVLDEMITTPFACTLFFFDFLLLGLLIFFFRLCVDAYLQQKETDIVLRWLYATLFSAFHFQMRAIGRVVSLISMTRNMVFRNTILFNFWNILQTCCLFMVIWCIICIRFTAPYGKEEYELGNRIRWQFAVTTLLLWFNFLGLVKSINMKLATFVCAITQIIKDVYWYVVLIVGMILCFSQIFYTLLIPSNCEDVKGSREDCKPKEFYLLVYSVLLGELDDQMVGGIEDKAFALMLFFGFTFIMAIVMLNILIAVISDSYEKTMIKSTRLFGRARVHQLAEILALQDLFRLTDDNKISHRFVEWKYFKWTKGGFAFFAITTSVYLFWAIVDLTALGMREKQHGFWNLSFLVFLLNLAMFGIFVLLLASTAQNVDSKVDVNNWLMNSMYKKVQWITIRLLGKSNSHDSLIHDEWAGRLMFIKREIASSSKKTEEKLKLVQEELKRSKREAKELRNGVDAKLGQIQAQVEKLIEINIDAQNIAMGRSTI